VTLLAAGVPPGAIVINSSTPLWYLTRATGLIALVLLTASMVTAGRSAHDRARHGLGSAGTGRAR
jgi:hypothetical protein